jgi:hypothetical protein
MLNMGFNTDTFTRAVGQAKANKGRVATVAYRGLSVGALVYLFATFAQVRDVNQLREWVKSISQSRTAQVEAIDKRLDSLEKNASFINGQLGLPMLDFPLRNLNTNTP